MQTRQVFLKLGFTGLTTYKPGTRVWRPGTRLAVAAGCYCSVGLQLAVKCQKQLACREP